MGSGQYTMRVAATQVTTAPTPKPAAKIPSRPPAKPGQPPRPEALDGRSGGGALQTIEVVGRKPPLDAIELDAPLLTALATEGREKRRDVPLSTIAPHMIQAVIAIEDRRFY